MRFSEDDLRNYIKIKKSIRLMKARLVIASFLLACALISYFISNELTITFIAISFISLLELSLSTYTNRLIDMAEKLINSDAEILKAKTKINYR